MPPLMAGVKPDQDPARVMLIGCYGATMLAVQAFEFSLAVLVILAERPPTPAEREGAARRRFEKRVERARHLFQRATPSECKRELEGKLDPELLGRIGRLILWRNFLAHRYLRVRLDQRTDPAATLGRSCAELIKLTRAFESATTAVSQAYEPYLPSKEESPTPHFVIPALTEVARQMATQDEAELPSLESL